jgi:RHS repeat-associated protein
MQAGLPENGGSFLPPVFPTNTAVGNPASGISAQQVPLSTNHSPLSTDHLPLKNNPSPPTTTQSSPSSNIFSSPVLDSVWRFGPAGHSRLLIQGSVTNTAPLQTQVPIDFYAKDPVGGTSWFLGSKSVTQTLAGSINFTVDLPADVAPGTWITAEVHGRPDASGVMPSLDSLSDADWSRGMQLPGGPSGHAIPGRKLLDTVTIPVGNGESITLDAPGHPLDDIQIFHPPGLAAALPMGLIGFAVTNVPVGGHAIVRITLPERMQPSTYYRHDPNTGLLTPFLFDGQTGAEIHGNIITLHLVDGGLGDADGVANGVIVDPDGPGSGSLPYANVAIIPAATNGELVTLGSANPITNLQVSDAPNSAIVMPIGLFSYSLTNVPVGGTAQLAMIVPDDVYVDGYFKQDPVSRRLLPFDCCGSGLATIDGHTITLNLTDGGAGDQDGQANGVILDPSGPSAGTIYIPCDQGLGQGGWSSFQTGGTGGGIGTVTWANSVFTLTEGNSFDVGLKNTFTIPTSPNILTFDYKNLTFGTGTLGRMNDAFEVAFVAGAPSGLTATLAAGGALTVSQPYFYKVTATNAQGEFGPSNEATATPTVGNQTINLSWAAVSGATGYNVYRGTSSGGENVLIGQPVGTSFSDNGIAGSSRSPVFGLNGNSLVPTIAPGRNAFFNITRGQTTADLAPGVTVQGPNLQNGTVDLDISKLFAGASGTLIFRLVNNDPDTSTSVQITCHQAPVVTEKLANDTGPAGGPSAYFSDLLTSDPTVTGTAVASTGLNIAKLEAAVDTGAYTDITRFLNVNQYTWNPGALSAGSHTVYIRATDNATPTPNVTTVSLAFTVDAAPVANAGGNHSVNEGNLDTFSGMNSTPTIGSIYTYQWTLPDKSTVSGPNATTASYRFLQPGTYTVTLAVTDIAGMVGTNTATITVLNVAPNFVGTQLPDQTITETGTVSFMGTFTDVGPLDTHTASINWGDGTTSAGTIVEETGGIGGVPITPGTVTGSHVYAEEAFIPQVIVTVTDNGNLSSLPSTFAVTVNDLPPTLTLSGANAVSVGQIYTLNMSASGGPDLISGWTINWGDGTTTTLQDFAVLATHTYSTASVYTITASATTDDGAVNASPLIVTAGTPASVAISGPSSTNEGSVYTLNLINGGLVITQWVITWGDNSTTTLNTNASSAPHVYADGPATGPRMYTITATAYVNSTSYNANALSVTINNVGPTVTPAASQTYVKNTSFTLQAASFTVPGFTSSSAGTTESPFTASINWGDNTTTNNPTITVTQGQASPLTLTSGTVSASHTYTAAGNYTVTVTVSDDESASASAQFVLHVLASGPVKFYTVDKSAHTVFEYDSVGNLAGSFSLSHNNQNSWGITTNRDMSTLWMVDANQAVTVYVYNPDGSLKGYWIADKSVKSTQDIATDGADIYILDNSSSSPKIWRFANGASWTGGVNKKDVPTYLPTSSFALDPANGFPTGMVTDGVNIWVTDKPNSGSASVFIYNLAGTKLGNWTLDSADNRPTGITLNPNYLTSGTTTDLWVVDNAANNVFRYAGGSAWTSGSHLATSSFALSSSDSDPEGIADPVTVTVSAPASGVVFPQGSPVLVTGSASTTNSGAHITDVAVNGTAAVVDAGNNFFLPVTAAGGQTSIGVTAADSTSATGSNSVTVTGAGSVAATGNNPGAIDFSQLSDVTGSITTGYGITSLNSGTNVVYADLTATDTGTYSIRGPFLMEVKHISIPSVRVRGNTGVASDGTPFYDLSSLLPQPTSGPNSPWAGINPGQSITSTLSFYNPEGLQFTYDLVFLGRLNHPPRWTSAPVVTAVAGTLYSYTPTAIDPDGDPVRFSVVSGPAGMGLTDYARGPIVWLTSTTSTGNYPIRLRVSDNQGGFADQTFILSVVSNSVNYPPVITSSPVVDANVNVPYTYQATAFDLDGDNLTFSLVSAPTGMIPINSYSQGTQGGVTLSWTPADGQTGTQTVTLKVTDSGTGNLSATQTYNILVQAQPGDHPPIFITTPITSIVSGFTYVYPSKAIDPDGDPVTYSLINTIVNGIPQGPPSRMTIDSNTGKISWIASGANQAHPVTILADDGRGGQATQAFNINVSISSSYGASLYGSKYDDVNGNGIRDGGNPTGNLGTITLNSYTLPTNSGPAFALAYDDAVHAMLVATTSTFSANVNHPVPPTTTIFQVQPTGAQTVFATIANEGIGDSTGMAVVPPGNTAGFTPGDVFLPVLPNTSSDGTSTQILRLSNNGATLTNPWATLTGTNVGTVYQLYMDNTGLSPWNDDLLALTSSGQIWQITPNGTATRLFGTLTVTGTGDGSFITVPNTPSTYGPLAGKLLFVGDNASAVTVDSAGTVAFPVGLNNIEDVTIIPAANTLFAINDSIGPGGSLSFWIAPGSQFAPLIGQLLVNHEYVGTTPWNPSGMGNFERVWYDGSQLQHQTLASNPSNNFWEQAAFIPGPAEPGLPNWTIYLDTNNNGQLDTGEPFTKTDVNGNYSFTNLAPNTYHVREVPQTGWNQTGPAPVPPGSYTVTVTYGQVVNGLDFGNQPTTPPPDTPPSFSSTAITMAQVGQVYLYPAGASDSDGDTLNFDLPVHPKGMAVDGPSGTVAWVPTVDEIGTATVLLRVTDSRGSIALQPYQVTVTPPDTPPVITSTPITTGTLNVPYQYQVHAQDAEHETLSFSLTSPPTPSTMSIDGRSGIISWTPTAAGTYTVTVQAADVHASVSQIYTLTIASNSSDTTPTFTSSAPTSIALGQTYYYQVAASDADNDVLSFSLPTAAPNMGFNTNFKIANQAMITWTPTASMIVNGVNTFNVTVQVSDGRGGTRQQPFTITVYDQSTNQKPVITSSPPLVATVGSMYSYNLTGYDPDYDPIYWSLVSGPWGMSIDPNWGTLRWLPDVTQVGNQTVTVKLTDPYGGSVTQTWTIAVKGAGLPPVITSEPWLLGVVNQQYTYAVQANDADGDPLTYSIVQGSVGGFSTTTPNLFIFTPSYPTTYTATIKVSDGNGNTVTQSWPIIVSSSSTNYAPVITSTPGTGAVVGRQYIYNLASYDQDGDTQTYSLGTVTPAPTPNPPNPNTLKIIGSQLTWTPVAADAGTGPNGQNFTITVIDTDSGTGHLTAPQTYTLTVKASDSGPSISNWMPPTTAIIGAPYRYDVQASDSDGDPLTYALNGAPTTGNPAMSIDPNTGRITWTPTGTPTTYSGITVTVTDSFGVSTPSPAFSVTTSNDTTPPAVELQLSPGTTVSTGTKVTFLVLATDDVSVASETLTVGSTNLNTDSKGQAVMTMNTVGNFTVTATAKDPAGNVGTATATLAVSNPTGTPPTISVTAPVPDANGNVFITAPTAITGSVSDDHTNGVSYTVTVIPFDGSPSFQIGSGSTTSASSLTLSNVTFDPTMLASGPYTLEVKATDVDDNLTTTLDRNVSVQAKLKLGREQLSVTDLTIPVAGVPLTITRSYDSLAAGMSGDFGYGWRLGFGDARLTVDLSTTFDAGWGGLPAFQTGTRVYLTMPDGSREGFTFNPYPQALDSFGLITVWHPAFTADDGVLDALTVPDVQLTQDLTNGGYYIITDAGGLDYYNPADPTFGGIYTATNTTGLASTIDANSGKVVSMKARNNNTLTFSTNAITSNTGKVVTISRDPQGRITAITDPRVNSVTYGYDINGNLVSVTDRAGDPATGYTYDTAHAHYLKMIQQPIAIVNSLPVYVNQLTVSYNSTTGRMTQVTDANGNPLQFVYSVSAQTSTQGETITDPNLPLNAQMATVSFDNRGDPLNVTDPTGAQSSATFMNTGAQRDLPDTVTQVRRNPDNTTTSLTTTVGYDTNGNVTSTTDPTQATTRMTYGPFGVVQTVSDALGNTVTNSYDNNGNLLSTVSAAGVATSYGYDANNNLTSVTQGPTRSPYGPPPPPAAVTLYTYDSAGYMNSSTSPTGVVTTYSTDPNGNPTGTSMTWVDPNNSSNVQTVTTSTAYDALDRARSSVDQYNHTSQTIYDLKGRVTQTIDVLGNTTTNVYDARDELIQTIYPVDPNYPQSLVSESVYDPEGRVSYATDPHLPNQADIRGTHTFYDSMGRVYQTDRLDGITINISTTNGVSSSSLGSAGTPIFTTTTNYNDLGQVTKTIDAANQSTNLSTTYQYDLAGRQTQVTDPLLETTKSGYDLAGRQISTTDALTNTTQYVLDGDGKVLKTIFADGSIALTGYDNLGRRTSATDQMGFTTQYQYDTFGRLTGVVLPPVSDPLNGNVVVNPTTNYSYDIYGDMTQIKDAYQHQTNFTFDQFGHQLTRTLPFMPTGSQPETSNYDGFGRLWTQWDFAGNKTVYGYDTLGRVHTKTLYASGSSTAGETITYHFDNWGRNDTVTDVGTSTRVTTYGYDVENRVTSVITPEGTINYGYDSIGRHNETSTANSDIWYGYDALSRVQTVTVKKQNGQTLTPWLVITYYYTPVGNIDHIIYPNGTETDYGYNNPLNRLTSVTNKVTGGNTLSSYSYTLNADGLRTGVTETDNLPSSVTKTWTYDNLQRLTGEAVGSNISGQSYTDTYSYDLVGNRVSKSHTVGTQTDVSNDSYNPDDQLTGESGTVSGVSYSVTYVYDANGSLKTITRTGAGAETDTYGYDFQNRFSSATINRTENGQSVAITASYTYDDSGYRASGTVTVNGGSPTTTAYLTDSNNGYSQVLEEHTNGAATPTISYILGLSVLGQTDSSGVTTWLMPDGAGSTRLLVNSSASITARFAYDAYGNLLVTPVGVLNPPATKILFTGQQFDAVLLQYYLRARYYNAMTCRFTTMDSFQGITQRPQTFAAYLYTADNPVNRIDPSGHQFSLIEQMVVSGIQTVGRWMKAAATFFVNLWVRFRLFLTSVIAALRQGWERFTALLQRTGEMIGRIPSWLWQRITDFFKPDVAVPSEAESAAQGVGSHRLLAAWWQRTVQWWSGNRDLQVNHFVEQGGRNATRFSKMAIHSPANSTPISEVYHNTISAFYSSGPRTLDFMAQDPAMSRFSRLRDYVQTLNWQRQWEWGYKVYTYVLENGDTAGFSPAKEALH